MGNFGCSGLLSLIMGTIQNEVNEGNLHIEELILTTECSLHFKRDRISRIAQCAVCTNIHLFAAIHQSRPISLDVILMQQCTVCYNEIVSSHVKSNDFSNTKQGKSF